MCGRFSITTKKEVLEERFKATFVEKAEPCYNAAPSQRLPVILNSDPEHIQLIHWGLMPPWISNIRGRDGIINVRTETLKAKHTFKYDLEKRRCLVIADGFYEWQKNKEGSKTPYRIALKSEEPFAFAGIWEVNKDKNGNQLTTFAIITTSANTLMAEIHERMPVILEPKEEKEWMSIEKYSIEDLLLLDPYPPAKMTLYEVSKMVNSTRNNNPVVMVKLK